MDRTQAMRYQKINSLLWNFSLPAIVGMVVNSPVSYTHLVQLPFAVAIRP